MSMAYERHSKNIYIFKKKSLRPRCAIDQNAFRLPGARTNMADARIRKSDWEEDNDLKNDLASFVSLNLKRMEILDFMRKDYPMYAWSLRNVARRMQQFTDYDVEVNEVEAAVKKEISGLGKLLGYRAMHKKIREIHGLNLPRDLVYMVMAKVDPSGLEERGGVGKTRRPRRDKAFMSGVSKVIPVQLPVRISPTRYM